MKRILGLGISGAVLMIALPAMAQTPTATETRPATTTASGDTGLFFVPTAEVLPDKKWSASFYRTNVDDGQGFSDVSHFPATFGYGIRGHFELFGAFTLVTRIDRDTRPLFFTSTSQEAAKGTGGGVLLVAPLNRTAWSGNKIGDFWLGGKINITSEADKSPVAFAIRPMIKLPTGSDGVSSGKLDFLADAVASKATDSLEYSVYGGLMMRGNPSDYSLTNGLRWGLGLGFPRAKSHGFLVTTELFGETYFNKTITAPAGQFGEDLSPVPTSTNIKSPVMLALGLTWQAPKGFFIGSSASWNLNMSERADAQAAACGAFACPSTFGENGKDNWGLNVRIGYHPGVRKYVAPPPPPPPAEPPPPPPPPPAPTNGPPTVRATCDPCTVEVGKTATVTADAQDPDGDALTYRWTAPAGTITAPTNRQTPWTAPMQVGPVQFTVTVNDGHGHTATANTTIQVVQPAVVSYTFEDVHFEFDKYTLQPDALRVLDEAVTAMRANATLRLEIEGHTCNIGTAEYNLALGERRASAVRDYLVSRGISADRLRTVSYGEEKPKFDNLREETRRLNRRAALVVNLRSE